MQATEVREASGRVIAVLMAAGRSRTTIKRHEAEFNAFAGFLDARGRALPRACASRLFPGGLSSRAGR